MTTPPAPEPSEPSATPRATAPGGAAPTAPSRPELNPLSLDSIEFNDGPSDPARASRADAEADEAPADDADDPAALKQAEADLSRELKEEEDELDERLNGTAEAAHLVVIAAYPQPAEAHIAASRLEGEGIPSVIADENTVATNWLYTIAVGGVKLLVNEADAARATDVLRNPSAGADETTGDSAQQRGDVGV